VSREGGIYRLLETSSVNSIPIFNSDKQDLSIGATTARSGDRDVCSEGLVWYYVTQRK
jgi:hypothetical protein